MLRSRLFLATVAALVLLVRPASADPVHEKGAEPLHISHGAAINVADYLVPGKTTVIDFYSEYCPPCRALAPLLLQLHKSRADLAVVEVDINRPGVTGIDWASPVVGQFHLDSIPRLTVYGPDGKMIADGMDAREMVVRWIEK